LNPITPATEELVILPEVLEYKQTPNSLNLTLKIPEKLSYFVGHFDQIPIVPGVVQIQWATHYAQQQLGLNLVFRHMEAIKFKELLLPGQSVELHLHYDKTIGKLEFCFRSENIEYSSGRLYFS
jgi:3-hydroxymyristoyl/3-hydroxydecanoyl-(acyl carrier protein) dehydratase